MRFLFFLVPLFVVVCQSTIDSTTTPPAPIWADEFDGTGAPDSTKWSYDLGGWGWGNNELQHYTDSTHNVRQENGYLIIEAHREPYGERAYTSARLVTRDRATWNRGRIEVRAQLPSGRGTWPAIWMLGEDIQEVGWPRCGEIDIMEHVGYNPDSVFATVHTDAFNHVEGTQVGNQLYVPDLETAFHTYAVDWRAERMDFSIDSTVYFTFQKPENATVAEWPFDTPHYLLLNLAVGGNWGGREGVDTTIWPQRMVVDWVRVYGPLE